LPVWYVKKIPIEILIIKMLLAGIRSFIIIQYLAGQADLLNYLKTRSSADADKPRDTFAVPIDIRRIIALHSFWNKKELLSV